MMDFADFDIKTLAKKGFDYELLSPKDGSPTGAVISMKGIGDIEVTDALMRFRRIDELAKIQTDRAQISGIEAIQKTKEANQKDAANDVILKAVTAWSGVSLNGQEMEFNRENVLRVLGEGSAFFAQVFDQVTEKQNLFTDAAKS